MNFVDKINQAHGVVIEREKLVQWIDSSGGTVPAWGDQEVLNKVYENLEIVYRCIFMAANNIASLPKKVFRKNKSDVDVDVTDLFPLFSKPNDYQTSIDFWIESISRILMQGELFWEMILENNRITPVALFADWRTEEVLIRTKDQQVSGYIRQIRGQQIPFDADEVFFIKDFNPYIKYRGMSRLRAARHSIEMDFNAIGFNKNFFKQGLKFNGILQTEQELDVSQTTHIRKEFEKIYGGVENMHKTAVLHSGLSFTALNDMSLQDAEFMGLREMNRENIAIVFGTPLEVLGIGKSTFQNEKYARRKYWTETLMPEIRRVEAMVNRFIIPRMIPKAPPDTYYFKFITKDVEALKEDRSAKVKDYLVGIRSKAISPNEMRQDVFNKDPWPDKEMDNPIPDFALGGGAASSGDQKDFDGHSCAEATALKKKFY